MQGCFEPLEELIRTIRFDPREDKLWFVGDLVNRGPDSLACLRFVKGLGDAAIAVLGNHDLHLLCVAEGVAERRKRDTLDEILEAPDRDELLAWLRGRPLAHVERGFALVHAGLAPQWTIADAERLASEVQSRLRAADYLTFLAELYGDRPRRWREELRGNDRLRVIVNAMTRLRVCEASGAMALDFKGEPGEGHHGLVPWFDVAGRRSTGTTIVCGHWSALGVVVRPDLISIDSGCVWGRSLTAVRLEDRTLHQVRCPPPRGQGA